MNPEAPTHPTPTQGPFALILPAESIAICSNDKQLR